MRLRYNNQRAEEKRYKRFNTALFKITFRHKLQNW